MSAVLEAARNFYAQFSTPTTLNTNSFAEQIRKGTWPIPPDPQGDTMALAETLSAAVWELGPETPEDGYTWTEETHRDLHQATALMMQVLDVFARALEREGPRYTEWDERTTQQRIAARGNVVPILRSPA